MKRRKLSWEEKTTLLMTAEYKCQNCGSTEKLEFDHIIPLARGGLDEFENMQVLCNKCNLIKRDTHDGVFQYQKYRNDELFQSAVLDFISGNREEADRKMELFKAKIELKG